LTTIAISPETRNSPQPYGKSTLTINRQFYGTAYA